MTEQTTNLAQSQFDRLPRYARFEIDRLARVLQEAKAALAAGPENSDTFADPFGDKARPLGTGTRVRFGGQGTDQTFDVIYQDGVLKVIAHGHLMAILPEVSNSFRVTFMDRPGS